MNQLYDLDLTFTEYKSHVYIYNSGVSSVSGLWIATSLRFMHLTRSLDSNRYVTLVVF